MLIGRITGLVLLLLFILLSAPCTLSGEVVEAEPVASAASPLEDAPPGEATTSKSQIGLIFGNLRILNLYGFPMSIGEGWALAGPAKAEKQPKPESSESLGPTEAPGKPDLTIEDEAVSSADDWEALTERLPHWVRKPHGFPAGAVAGVVLAVVVAGVGAAAFALYYHFSGQPEKISLILPRFAYWFPFGLLGLITDVPFQVFAWEDRRPRALLRLMLWWIPRVGIIAFAINLPILRGLDPATTALVVLAIDGALVAFFLWLHSAQERIPSVLR